MQRNWPLSGTQRGQEVNTYFDHVIEPADVLNGTWEVQAVESFSQSAVTMPLEAHTGPLELEVWATWSQGTDS